MAIPPSELSPSEQRRIKEAVAQPDPPPKWWGYSGLFKMESREWLEWHKARGRNYMDPKGRRRLSPGVRQQVIDRDGCICGLCGGPVDPPDIHIDHIQPVAMGGSDELRNLQVSHSTCNIKKGTRA